MTNNTDQIKILTSVHFEILRFYPNQTTYYFNEKIQKLNAYFMN